MAVIVLSLICIFTSCEMLSLPLPQEKEDVITIEDGYLVVNGVKTEYKIDDGTEPEIKEDVITVDKDGYLVVNGVKTEYEIKNKDHAFSEWELYNKDETDCEEKLYYRVCSDCSTLEWEEGKHIYFDDYFVDGSIHWKECKTCQKEIEKDNHTFRADGSCSVCGITIRGTDEIIYDVSSDGTYAEVLGYSGTATKIVIADTYNGLPVTNIYQGAFSNTSITSVVIPDSIITIGNLAFASCYKLKNITLGKNVATIGNNAFESCAFTRITIPNSVTCIRSNAFSYCSLLQSITFGDSITEIGSNAFMHCQSLTSVTFPSSVTSIGFEAFKGCSNLASVTLLNDATLIFGDAFSQCNSALYTEYEQGKYIGNASNPYEILIEVTSDTPLKTYKINENTKIIAYGVFMDCQRLMNIYLPDSITTISGAAFNSTDLRRIVLGKNVRLIGEAAFMHCKELSTVYYSGTAADWSIDIGIENIELENATRYYYSENQPTEAGNFWHYVDGVPTTWN